MLVVLAMLLVVTLVSGSAMAGGHEGRQLEVVTVFDATLGELPEGIAIDKVGNIYVSLGAVGGPFGQIRRISPDGTVTILATLDTAPAGLAVDARGDLYYAYPSFDPATQGAYRLTPGGVPERLPGTEDISLANGVALDKQGNLYVSDSVGNPPRGIIWHIPRGGGAERWIEDESLGGCGNIPGFPPIGANGVAYRQKHLYVANTEQGSMVRIPIEKGGDAGVPEIVAGVPDCDPAFDEMDGLDGIALDVHGDIYAVVVLQNKLVRIDGASGNVTELVSGRGFHNPASLSFGTGKGDRKALFITNFALVPPAPSDSSGPAVLKLDVGQPGMPLP